MHRGADHGVHLRKERGDTTSDYDRERKQLGGLYKDKNFHKSEKENKRTENCLAKNLPSCSLRGKGGGNRALKRRSR